MLKEVEYIIGIFYPGNSKIMGPKKKFKLAGSTSNAWRKEITRALETPEDAQARLAVQQTRQKATDSAQKATARAEEDNATALSDKLLTERDMQATDLDPGKTCIRQRSHMTSHCTMRTTLSSTLEG